MNVTHQRRIANHECLRCGVPLSANRPQQTCQECYEKAREYAKSRPSRRDRLFSLGLCVTCGKVPFVAGIKTCQPCADKATADACIRDKKRRAARVASQQCPKCGVPLPDTAHKNCPGCREKKRLEQLERVTRTREARLAAGQCERCGTPLLGGEPCSGCGATGTYEERKAITARNAERRAKGLCYRCGENPAHSAGMCAPCMSLNGAEAYRVRTARFEAEGTCVVCGDPRWHKAKKCRKHWVAAIIGNFVRGGLTNELIDATAKKLEDQNFTCAYTGESIIPGENATLDHVFPRAKYPELVMEPTNWAWASEAFNDVKSDVDPESPRLGFFSPLIAANIRAAAAAVNRSR